MNNTGKKKRIKRPTALLLICLGALSILVLRLFYLQIISYDEYQARVINNVQKETTVNPTRGNIYDSNMALLATNIATWRVFISPRDITDPQQSELIASNLSMLLGVDKGDIQTKAAKIERADETIKKNVDEETYTKVLEFVEANDLGKQIHFEETAKRYYPYSTLAANLIGVVGTDGGLSGLELQYENELTGIEGKYVTAKGATGSTMPYKYNSFIGAENGGNVVTTINTKIQKALEKQLENTYKDSEPLSRVCGIAMNPNDGSIYGMATYPTMDLNNPYELDENSKKDLEELIKSGVSENSDEYNDAYWEKVYALWKNKAVSELYEPGSTFKVMTTAAALEENVVTFDDTFYCGYDNFYVKGYDEPIRCHYKSGHGTIPFSEGLQQSCNVTLMNVAFKLGLEKFYDYFMRFGYTDRTGVDLPGEAYPIYTELNDFNAVSLAVYSFGQTFKVTPLQQLRGICAIANGGNLISPHVVNYIIDDDSNIVYSYNPHIVRQVVSSDVCSEISTVLEEGVSGNGGAKNTYVAGYKIAAKTGTSQVRDVLNKYGESYLVVGSTVAYAPSDDPKIAVLIMVDSPTCSNQYGSVVAAPYVAAFLEDVLPILGVDKNYSDSESEYISVAVSDYSGQSLDKVKESISAKGLSYKVMGDGETVNSQLPSGGTLLMRKYGQVVLYTGDADPQKNIVTVPNLNGYSAESACSKLESMGFNVEVSGSISDTAIVTDQQYPSGTDLPRGSMVCITVRSLGGTE